MTIDTTARGVLECVNTAFTDAKSGRYKIDRSFYVGDVGLWFYVKELRKRKILSFQRNKSILS